MDPLSIRQCIEKVTNGQLRIPAFQRGFVWDAERVAFLMDSIYKGYPFGSLILWRTRTPLRTERQLGPFGMQQWDADYPTDYVLDGQQRLTSVFGVFQTDLEAATDVDSSWRDIYFDMEAGIDLQDSQFVYVDPHDVDSRRFFPIGTFFDAVAYRRATESLTASQIQQMDEVQALFKEAKIPLQLIETDDRAKVAIVFERVNRLGVELDTLQLLSAWTWSEEFDLQERFKDLAAELEPFGFGAVGEDTNLLLRVCSAVVAGDVSSSTLLNLNGAEVRTRFDEIENGMRGAIEFVRNNFHVQKLANLPFPSMLVPLSVFFAVPGTTDHRMTAAQRGELSKWFWRSCISRRFSGDVLRRLNTDINQCRQLRNNNKSSLAEIPCTIDEDWFIENKFSVAAVNTKTFVLMLAQMKPRSFVSGNTVRLGPVLQNYNRAEFHHLFPRAFLKAQEDLGVDANSLVNFAIISATDNRALSGVAPSSYKAKMPDDPAKMARVLSSAVVPVSLFGDDYGTFSDERARDLLALAKRLAKLP